MFASDLHGALSYKRESCDGVDKSNIMAKTRMHMTAKITSCQEQPTLESTSTQAVSQARMK